MSSSDEMFVLMVIVLAAGWIVLIVVGLVLFGVYRGVRALFRARAGGSRTGVESVAPEDAVPPGYDADGSK